MLASRPRTHCGSRSMCGAQVLSHKSSSPSFSFGSGPARLSLTGLSASASKAAVLQPSSSEPQLTPGPVYNPVPSSKWLGDAPHASFGTQRQRPVTAASEVSSFTGKSNLPGPGTYGAQSSIGTQSLARCRSNTAWSFGQSKQHEIANNPSLSPGPVYVVPSKVTRGGRLVRSAYSFGSEARCGSANPRTRTPGPGTYNVRSGLGAQVGHPRRGRGPTRALSRHAPPLVPM